MRLLAFCILLPLAASPLSAQNKDSQNVTTDCTFADGRQISIQYKPGKSEETRNGKIWTPGGAPMILFAQTPLTVGPAAIAPGAYTVYTIPGKKEWTLIVNKNVTAGSAYDPAQDLSRESMETGTIDSPVKGVQLSFAHIAPKDCSLRLYIGKIGAYAEFKEQ